MLEVMKKITDKPAIILGFSDGAYTALELAVIRPQAVERIVTIGAGTLQQGFFLPRCRLMPWKNWTSRMWTKCENLCPNHSD